MIQKIKAFFKALTLRIKDFLLKVDSKYHLVVKWLISAYNWLKWPRWYFVVLFIGMPLMAFEITGTWFGFVWPAVGGFIWAYKTRMK